MAIKIFFKHLFTSIRRRPAQPLLLILVIALAVSLISVSFNMREYLGKEYELKNLATVGNSNYSVSFSSESTTRFMFVDDIKNIIGDDKVVCGTFALPIYYGNNEFEYGVASDYKTVNDMFDIELIDSMPLYQEDVDRSILITQAFANRASLKVGDTIELSILGMSKEYVVYGISQALFMGDYSILMDESGVVSSIAESSLFIAMLGDKFMPSSKVYVTTNGNVKSEIEQIKSSFDNIIAKEVKLESRATNDFDLIILLIVLITIFFSFAVTYCCFAVLTAQRKEENNLFYTVGAKAYMLNLMSVAELLLYWIVGGAIGIGITVPLSTLFVVKAACDYVTAYMLPWIFGVALAITLASVEGGMALFIILERFKNKSKKVAKEHNGRKDLIIAIVMICLTIIMAGLTCLKTVKGKDIIGIISYFMALSTAYFCSKKAFPAVAKRLSKSEKFSVTTRYAIKNSYRVESNANATSVLTVFFIVIVTMALLISFADKTIDYSVNLIRGDYLIQSITSSSYDTLQETDGVSEVYYLYSDRGIIGRTTPLVISSNSKEAFSDKIRIDKMPVGNEAMIPKWYAAVIDLEIGDEFTLTINDKNYNLVYVGNYDHNGYNLIINTHDLGISYKYVEVIGEDGFDKDELHQNITDALALDNAIIISKSKFSETRLQNVSRYFICAIFVAVFLTLFAFIGIIDSIVSSYISRKEEFECFASAGMNKKAIRKLIAMEILYVLLISLLITIIFFGFDFLSAIKIIEATSNNFFIVFR